MYHYMNTINLIDSYMDLPLFGVLRDDVWCTVLINSVGFVLIGEPLDFQSGFFVTSVGSLVDLLPGVDGRWLVIFASVELDVIEFFEVCTEKDDIM